MIFGKEALVLLKMDNIEYLWSRMRKYECDECISDRQKSPEELWVMFCKNYFVLSCRRHLHRNKSFGWKTYEG